MVRVEHLEKIYGKKKVLIDASFEAYCGQQIAIIGSNGSGKSTLLQILAGVEKPSQGKITYFGQDAINKRKVFAQYCGYLPQENPLMEDLTVQDNISLWSGKRGKPKEEIMEMFSLYEIIKKPVSKLSGGMKRRVSIACAILHHPPIMLMDEPTTALDANYRDMIHQWMKEYRECNGIIFVATHDKTEIEASNQCLMIEGGYVKNIIKE